MPPETDLAEGKLLPDVITSTAPAPLTLFGTSDPATALARMSDLAKVLVDVVRDRKLAVRISGREHLTAEAWMTLGGMLGVTPVVEWTRPLADGTGWEARVDARTLDGRVIGAAESMCSRSESTWAKRDDFALRSMSQTRAIARSLRSVLGMIVVLAGYEPAGAEEMPNDPEHAQKTEPEPSRPTLLQKQQIRALFERLTEAAPSVNWADHCRKAAGVPADKLSEAGAGAVIEQMQAWLAEITGAPGA